MKNNFLNKELSQKLVSLGFNYGCFAVYDSLDNDLHTWRVPDTLVYPKDVPDSSVAILYQQALDWLRETYKVHIGVCYIDELLKFQAEICLMNSNTIISDTKCGKYYDVLIDAIEITLNLKNYDN